MDFFSKILDQDFMPHGHCYLWRPEVLWPHVIGDGLTALAYFTIPFLLFYFIKKRNDIRFTKIFIAFALFIFFCGATHALAIVSVWNPIYRLEGVVKLATAAISIGTVALLMVRMKEILAIPSVVELKRSKERLSEEVETRMGAEAEVKLLNRNLEEKVLRRTQQLKHV